MFASVFTIIVLMWIFIPMFASDLDIEFGHDPNVEFMADELHDLKLRIGREANKKRLVALVYANRPIRGADPEVLETNDNIDTELMPIKNR